MMNMQHFPRINLAAKLPPIQAPPAPLLMAGLLLVCVIIIALLPLVAGVLLLAAAVVTLAVLIVPWVGLVALAIAISWASAWPLTVGGAAWMAQICCWR